MASTCTRKTAATKTGNVSGSFEISFQARCCTRERWDFASRELAVQRYSLQLAAWEETINLD